MTNRNKCSGNFEELALISPKLFNSLLERLPAATQTGDIGKGLTSEPNPDIREELKNRAAQKMNEALSLEDTPDPANATKKIKAYKKALTTYKKQVLGNRPLNRSSHVPKRTSDEMDTGHDSDGVSEKGDDDDEEEEDNEDDEDFMTSDEDEGGSGGANLRDQLEDQLTANQMDNAETILRYIKRSGGRIAYDQATEELLIDNKPIKNSNLPTLIVSLVRSLRTSEGVGHAGQLELAHALVTGERMAKSMIKNKVLLQQLATSKPPIYKTSWGDRKRGQRKGSIPGKNQAQ